jgi:adenine-specific DNA-methyltransferase
LDKVDSTLGHQSSYLKEWSERSYKTMQLKMPDFCNPYGLKHNVLQKDIFSICNKYHDLAYYDPPYGSSNDKMPASRVRYKCYYHIWETICQNDLPETFGACNRRLDTKDHNNINPFEDFRKTEGVYNSDIAIENLINKTHSKYILFSYNSNGRTSLENLFKILKKYLIIKNLEKINYRKNIMAYMDKKKCWKNDLQNYEILIMGERK